MLSGGKGSGPGGLNGIGGLSAPGSPEDRLSEAMGENVEKRYQRKLGDERKMRRITILRQQIREEEAAGWRALLGGMGAGIATERMGKLTKAIPEFGRQRRVVKGALATDNYELASLGFTALANALVPGAQIGTYTKAIGEVLFGGVEAIAHFNKAAELSHELAELLKAAPLTGRKYDGLSPEYRKPAVTGSRDIDLSDVLADMKNW